MREIFRREISRERVAQSGPLYTTTFDLYNEYNICLASFFI